MFFISSSLYNCLTISFDKIHLTNWHNLLCLQQWKVISNSVKRCLVLCGDSMIRWTCSSYYPACVLDLVRIGEYCFLFAAWAVLRASGIWCQVSREECLMGRCKQLSPSMKGVGKYIGTWEIFMHHDGNTRKTEKARIILARAIRSYMTPIYGNLGFLSSILMEILVLAKFADMGTALLSCIVPRGSSFPWKD